MAQPGKRKRGKEIIDAMRSAPKHGLSQRALRLLGKPHSGYQCVINKRTGKYGKKICLMKNECLSCDGKCVGYRKTAKKMAPIREAYQEKQAVLRRKLRRRQQTQQAHK